MSIFIPVAILILAMLIQAFMQLTPGIFVLFHHYALGKKSTKKANNLDSYFILGIIVFIVATWLIIYNLIFIIFRDKPDFSSGPYPWIMTGIFFAESFLGLFFYYRKGKFTTLFISRSSANSYFNQAKQVKTKSDAFTLGFLSNIPELLFTLPLYIISATELMKITFFPRALIILAYIIISILPILFFRTLYLLGRNLAEIEQLRIRIKPLVRIVLFAGFLLLAFATIKTGIINHG